MGFNRFIIAAFEIVCMKELFPFQKGSWWIQSAFDGVDLLLNQNRANVTSRIFCI